MPFLRHPAPVALLPALLLAVIITAFAPAGAQPPSPTPTPLRMPVPSAGDAPATNAAQAPADGDGESAEQAPEQSPVQALHALFADEWAFRLQENPLFATSAGEHRYDDRLPAVAPQDHARRAQASREFRARLHAIDRDALPEAEKVNYDVFDFMLRHRVEGAAFRDWRIPLNSDSGFYMTLNWAARSHPFNTPQDYQNWVRRLSAFPAFIDQHIANMRQGVEDGFTLPAEILDGIAVVIESMAQAPVEENAAFAPFLKVPASIDPELAAALPEVGRFAVEMEVIPALQRFHQFFVEEYAPAARASLGAGELPDGDAYYASRVRYYTNLELTPAEVHQIGLNEVARIRAQMEEIIADVGFEGSFAEFLAFLRSDPQFFATTPRELLMHASYLAKKADGKLPSLFGKLPRQPYTVEPVPDAIAPNYTSGRYVGAPLDGTRAGAYWVNTWALDKRTLYTLPALTLHEAVPGHHLQNALAKELEGRPPFRRYLYPHAFGEGWGLYAEKLGVEMGMYETPYDDFGRLTYEMWRACRLVVDTGVHAMGWTRQQALDYLANNTALSLHEVRTEIDRYISWPGQALAYKIGELKFLELRARATEALGTDFDIREFHDLVMSEGGVPLPVLEGMVERFLAARAAAVEGDAR